jgi:hypothetical protein
MSNRFWQASPAPGFARHVVQAAVLQGFRVAGGNFNFSGGSVWREWRAAFR